MARLLSLLVFALFGCTPQHRLLKHTAAERPHGALSVLVQRLDTLGPAIREDLLKEQVLSGHVPLFFYRFFKISVRLKTSDGRVVKAQYYVSPDYLAVGTDADFLRIPLTPHTAQAIADSLHCFLPTRKMVDDIYRAAAIKLEPRPLTQERERMATFRQHHALIEGERRGRKGLIAGIKKDVVISNAVAADPRPDRVAIYGWHRLDGKPVQPLYCGHVAHYVDYSHGIRLVYEMIKVNDKWMHYTEILGDPELKGLLCDEENCTFYRYSR